MIDHNPALLQRAQAHLATALVVPSVQAKGLSGARNTGWGLATGDVVAFLDDDARADADWADLVLSTYQDDVIGAGGAVVPHWRAPCPGWLPDEFLWVVGCSFRGQPTKQTPVRNAIGANMSFRREILDATGGFQTVLGRQGADVAGCEETELSIRAQALRPGSKILLEPAATVRHVVTGARTTRRYFRQRCIGEGRSKALVAGLVGQGPALDSERRYVSRVLPAGVLRGVGDLARGDVDGGRRSLAIVEGLALTAFGYGSMRVRMSLRDAQVVRRVNDAAGRLSSLRTVRGSISAGSRGPAGAGPDGRWRARRNRGQSQREHSLPGR